MPTAMGTSTQQSLRNQSPLAEWYSNSMVCLEQLALNIDYELILVNIFLGVQKQPSYLEKQPFGKVPVLDDDGFLIYESRTICSYLARKYADKGTKLIPAEGDLKAYGLFEQACSIEQAYFDADTYGVCFEHAIKQ
ncbi:hypothetical protein OCU04_008964 [Sclerotinia nivalis]|uniref:glutathione transferase n=1 Tax=Sclerotinia nivalis TaxID=352851 RepID=A0A9X0AHG1_9HELO|nr:hypothetical protein OCU04_008964 [Sclerotinia nivalis]